MNSIEGTGWEELLTHLQEELVARKQGLKLPGGEIAWAEALRRIAKRTRILFHHRADLKSQDLEDICQSVALKLQSEETLKRIRAAGSAEGYLVVTLRNAANDLARKRQREELFLKGVNAGGTDLGRSRQREHIHSESIQRALAGLEPAARSLLEKRYVEGLTIAEAAKALGITYSAAAVRLFRALQRLKALAESPR